MGEIERIVAELTAAPKSLAKAQRSLPAEPGLYSWWTRRGSIPSVPQCPHESEPDLDLFYVGISPSRATSTRTLRARIIQNHLGGNTGSSTFRLTLASLLFEEKGWVPLMQSSAVLLADDNRALTIWQHENLRLNWAVQPKPWTIEHEVIKRLNPPLNLAGNKSHPFATTLSAARKRFKEAAISGGL